MADNNSKQENSNPTKTPTQLFSGAWKWIALTAVAIVLVVAILSILWTNKDPAATWFDVRIAVLAPAGLLFAYLIWMMLKTKQDWDFWMGVALGRGTAAGRIR